MIPALQFTNWQWLALALAAPVAVWGAWPFHRAAWVNLRHGAATMDTLISVGVLAALGWSLYALFLGDAGMPGMTMTFEFFGEVGSGADEIYLEVAAAVTVFILAGRYFEARAKTRSSAAITALLELGAKYAMVLRDGVEVRIPAGDLVGRRPLRRAAGREGRHRRPRRRRRLRHRREHAHRRIGSGRGRPRRSRRRGDHQLGRASRRAGDQGRRRDRARGHGPARRAGADRKGRGAAARRPGVGGVRAGRHRARARDARHLAARRRRCRSGVHRGRRDTHHRLPVRARTRHARRRCSSARGAAPSSASSSRVRRSSSRRAGSTPSCSTRPARSPPAA